MLKLKIFENLKLLMQILNIVHEIEIDAIDCDVLK